MAIGHHLGSQCAIRHQAPCCLLEETPGAGGEVFTVCFRYFDTITLEQFEFYKIPPQGTLTLGAPGEVGRLVNCSGKRVIIRWASGLYYSCSAKNQEGQK